MATYSASATLDLLTRFMVETHDTTNLIGVPTGFQSFFGNPATGGRTRFSTDAKTVEFDVRAGQQGMTTLVHRGIVSQPLDKTRLTGGRHTAFNRAFPLGEDEAIISADQILERAFGESAAQTMSRLDRMRQMARELGDEMVRRAIRTQEYLAAQMIRTGKQDTIIGTTSTDEQLDTKRLTAHTMSPSASWALAGTHILTDFDSAYELGRLQGYSIDTVVLGSDIPTYLLSNTDIGNWAAKSGAMTSGFEVAWIGENVKVGPQFQRMVDNGFNPVARFRTPKGRTITAFTYEGGYVSSGTFYPYVPTDYAIFMDSQARCDRYFGPPERMPMTTSDRQDFVDVFGLDPATLPAPANVGSVGDAVRMEEFYFDVRRSSDAKSLVIRCQYAPMYITTDTNAFVTVDTVP